MPNISASLSDEAYAIFRDYPGKKSPWINDLILEGDDLFRKWKALDNRVGYLQGVISIIMTDLFLSRQGVEGHPLSLEQVLRWNQALDALDGTIMFHNHSFMEVEE